MKKKAVILFMASVLALGTLVGCNTADKEDLEGFKNAMSSVVSEIDSNDNAMSSASSAIDSNDTAKVTSVKGITFERPSEWAENSGEICSLLLPTNNIDDYQIQLICADLGFEYKDFEWDKQAVDAITESRKADMKESEFTFTSDEEVIVCGKYARKVSSSYTLYGTEYNEIKYIFGNNSYVYEFSNRYKSSNGNTYEKEFENIIKSIKFVSAIDSNDTVKVTSVKGITFERPSEWSKGENSGELFSIMLPTNNIDDYLIKCFCADLGSEYEDFEWDKQTVDAIAESTKADMKESKGAKFTLTSDEEVTVCGKYARKVSSSYNLDGTEYNMITYIFGNNRYGYEYSNVYKSSLGNTYEKEFENMIKSIEFV